MYIYTAFRPASQWLILTAVGRRSSRDRFSHVQSSGYGKRSPEVTPRKSHSPSVSPIRPAERGKMMHSSLDSTRKSRKGQWLGLIGLLKKIGLLKRVGLLNRTGLLLNSMVCFLLIGVGFLIELGCWKGFGVLKRIGLLNRIRLLLKRIGLLKRIWLLNRTGLLFQKIGFLNRIRLLRGLGCWTRLGCWIGLGYCGI